MSDKAMPAEFGEWFGKNYPGPNTIISDPHWHAPRIWRAARHAILAAAQQPPADQEWQPQDWKGMDGATTWLLINRHASGWQAVGEMMDAWLAANAPQPHAESQPVGEAGSLPGSNGGFTTAVFKASDVPVGTKLYTAPPSAPVGVEAIVEAIISDPANATDTDTLRRCVASALAQQPAAVDGALVREYIEARDAYEDATLPLNSHAPAPRLKHGDPMVLRYQRARAALTAHQGGES